MQGGSKPGTGRGGRLPGAGRKPGVPNKVKQELRDLARQYTAEALKRTVHWMRKGSEMASIRAIEILFERGHGKATQVLEVKRTPFDDMSPNELRALEEALSALPDDAGGPPVGDQTPPVDGKAGGISSVH